MKTMKKDRNCTAEWAEYQAGINYNNGIGYKSTVDKNERFYSGDHWRGVPSKNLPTPVNNALKRIVDSKISYILSQPLKIHYSGVKGDVKNEMGKVVGKRDGIGEKLSSAAAYHWEKDNLDFYMRLALLNAALSGDMCAHVYWESGPNSPDAITGDFCTEILDGINVYFGNPNESRAQKQPYIIVPRRKMTALLREEAKAEGAKPEDIAKIMPDSDFENEAGDMSAYELDNSQKTTYITKYYRKDGKIFCSKSTKAVKFISDRDTGLKLYPIAWRNWIPRTNSYHGVAEITHLIGTQLYINKQLALAQKSLMDTAFPKVVYDRTRVNAAWSNAVGEAIPVTGSIDNFARAIDGGQMDSSVLSVLDKTINFLYQSTGITEALTGEMRPENTSAIIALQKAAATTLDMQKASAFQFAEDIGELWLDFMRSKYRSGKVLYVNTEDGLEPLTIDSDAIRDMVIRTRIDVGASTMWSEALAVETLSNLLAAGKITLRQFLERLPRGVIPRTDELIQETVQLENQTAALQAALQNTQGGNLLPETPPGGAL